MSADKEGQNCLQNREPHRHILKQENGKRTLEKKRKGKIKRKNENYT